MLCGKIWCDDGDLVFIDDAHDLADLVERKIGYDAGQMVRQLIDLADEVKQKLDSDLLAYESQLEEQRHAFQEINDSTNHLLTLIGQSKIAAKTKEAILKNLIAIQKEVSNHL